MPKRKSDVIDLTEDVERSQDGIETVAKPSKKARVSKASGASKSRSLSDDESENDQEASEPSSSRAPVKPKTWQDVKLEGEDIEV